MIFAKPSSWPLLCCCCFFVSFYSVHHDLMHALQTSFDIQDPNENFLQHYQNNSLDETRAARVWTQLTFSVEFDSKIIPHAIEHYKSVGLNPDQFLITLHHHDRNAPELREMTRHLRQDLGIAHVQTWHGNFTSDKNCEMRYQHRDDVGVGECDWVLKFDADEFLQVPGGNMLSFLEMLGHQGFDSLSGSWVDRVAKQGKLPNITDTPRLAEQFPLGCQFSALAGNATTRKVVAFRGYLKEKRAGHSLMKGQETCRYPVMMALDHYKWSWPVYDKLKRRMEHYKNIEGIYWWTESEAFLNHIASNNDHIDVSHKDFQCIDSAQRHSPIHSFFPIENGDTEAEPCTRVRQCPKKLI